MSPRLSSLQLPSIQHVKTPEYTRNEALNWIVHLGIGAFHRAHQAVYTEQLNNAGSTRWGIIGCSLRSSQVKHQLEPQDNLYTVLERGNEVRAQIVGCVQQVLVGPDNPAAIIHSIADPKTRIVSLTVTEKGYCHNPATGDLNLQHPDIQHDLENLEEPRTAVGYLVAGLRQRFAANLPPVTVLSCDNLPHNGRVAENVVKQFAQAVNRQLAHWIDNQVSFPSTMVDRIVPATTKDDIEECERLFHYRDLGLVVAEPFTQWVIEDRFCATRPRWEDAGALLVDHVDVYETMKLRLLNGSHSLLAYAGYLSGCETVFDTIQNPSLKALCQRFMALAATTFAAPEGFDVQRYQAQLIERFSNPSLKHRTWQIAMDGSQKVPQRWLNSVRQLIKQNADYSLFAFALAAWIRFTQGVDRKGDTYSVSDPLAAEFQSIYADCNHDPETYVQTFFAQESIFGDLSHHTGLIQTTTVYLTKISDSGIDSVLEELHRL